MPAVSHDDCDVALIDFFSVGFASLAVIADRARKVGFVRIGDLHIPCSE